jgi:predicted GIY-YIG superfamily endonuclease
MAFYAYILQCSDASYYTGHTDDLEARLVAHRRGTFKGYTHSRRPLRLVWCEAFPTRDEAFQAERQIKGWSRAKKDALIELDWDRLVALAAIRGTGPSDLETPYSSEPRPSRASGRAVVKVPAAESEPAVVKGPSTGSEGTELD